MYSGVTAQLSRGDQETRDDTDIPQSLHPCGTRENTTEAIHACPLTAELSAAVNPVRSSARGLERRSSHSRTASKNTG